MRLTAVVCKWILIFMNIMQKPLKRLNSCNKNLHKQYFILCLLFSSFFFLSKLCDFCKWFLSINFRRKKWPCRWTKQYFEEEIGLSYKQCTDTTRTSRTEPTRVCMPTEGNPMVYPSGNLTITRHWVRALSLKFRQMTINPRTATIKV